MKNEREEVKESKITISKKLKKYLGYSFCQKKSKLVLCCQRVRTKSREVVSVRQISAQK